MEYNEVLESGEFDVFLLVFDRLASQKYNMSWYDFFYRTRWKRSKQMYELLMEKMKPDGPPINWNEFAMIRTMARMAPKSGTD